MAGDLIYKLYISHLLEIKIVESENLLFPIFYFVTLTIFLNF